MQHPVTFVCKEQAHDWQAVVISYLQFPCFLLGTPGTMNFRGWGMHYEIKDHELKTHQRKKNGVTLLFGA